MTKRLHHVMSNEIFGGYPWYRDEKIRNENNFPWSKSTDYRVSFLKDEIVRGINPEKYVIDKYNKTLAQTSKIRNLSKLESRMKEMVNLNLNWFMQTLLEIKVKKC